MKSKGKRKLNRNRKLPLILFIISIVLLVVGLSMGEYSTVFEQAITVCLSCIGIG